ncbi:Protein kinase-like domain protein [Niveomyces insectorum RCEF 264]|uniref:EKC/KEOPS complex subunit BUD32 n=1 Tax=Niveomyces insectorum RCEF 264 TaxID=1081102 RepID=A0A162J1Q8_9HYPO|nr:Protein kinase-like domain protein [Niveomyces insectorum RCEF 264]
MGRLIYEPIWAPPAEPCTPAFPYRAGCSLAIRRHVPPPPFGRGYVRGDHHRPRADRGSRPDATQTEWCLAFPPQDNPLSPPHPDASVRTLHIVDQIACRDKIGSDDGHGAQVVRCRWGDNDDNNDDGKPGGPTTYYVAKIYDALYYRLHEWDGDTSDVTYTADRDYAVEAAAYERLCGAGVNGRYSPVYYGSWTFDVPVPAVSASRKPPKSAQHPQRPSLAHRPVRMILMEWIPGVSMQSYLDTNKIDELSPTRRLDILAKAMEATSYLEFHGVMHSDFAPRNVLVKDTAGADAGAATNTDTKVPDVYIIDFNASYVLDSPFYRDQRKQAGTLPMNPMHLFWNNTLQDFGRWVPLTYHRQRPVFNGWLHKKWSRAKGFLVANAAMREYYKLDSEFTYIPPE